MVDQEKSLLVSGLHSVQSFLLLTLFILGWTKTCSVELRFHLDAILFLLASFGLKVHLNSQDFHHLVVGFLPDLILEILELLKLELVIDHVMALLKVSIKRVS